MLLLPIENITYQTKLTKEETSKQLKDAIAQKEYEGEVILREIFEIKRVSLFSGNLFGAAILGTIEKAPDGGSIIKVKMRPNFFAACLVCFWFMFFLYIFFITGNFWEHLLFGYVYVMAFFKFESYQSKKDLKRIFHAEIIKK